MYMSTYTSTPQGSETLVVLHVTPQRATRALALRYILRSLGRPMDHLALLACPRKMREDQEGGLVLSAFTSDFGDLLAGWQHVRAQCVAFMQLTQQAPHTWEGFHTLLVFVPIHHTQYHPIQTQVTVLTPMARMLYSNARSISMEYSEPKMEGDSGDDGLAPIEELTTTLQAYDLQSRVAVAKEVGSMVKRVVEGIDDPMAGQPQFPEGS